MGDENGDVVVGDDEIGRVVVGEGMGSDEEGLKMTSD